MNRWRTQAIGALLELHVCAQQSHCQRVLPGARRWESTADCTLKTSCLWGLAPFPLWFCVILYSQSWLGPICILLPLNAISYLYFNCPGLYWMSFMFWLRGFVAKSCPTLAIPWAVACQVPLSTGFSRQKYWSGLPFPSLEHLGIEPACTADALPTELPGKPHFLTWILLITPS